jgi:hypothetical protein
MTFFFEFFTRKNFFREVKQKLFFSTLMRAPLDGARSGGVADAFGRRSRVVARRSRDALR